mmetsp:Transcript_4299/g.12323  ORF Transcript_4299/g.12323 Transcript_4299/m.12323 type:complete len:222 (+) Transcript_4299:709-1374(+)
MVVHGSRNDLDHGIGLRHRPQPLGGADHVAKDNPFRIDVVGCAHQDLDGPEGGSPRRQHRIAQQNVGGFLGRGELAVKEFRDLVGVGFVPLDEDLSDADRRFHLPDHFQQGVPAPNDRDGTDCRGIGSEASVAGTTGSVYDNLGGREFRQGIFRQESHGALRVFHKIRGGRGHISHFRKERAMGFRGRNHEIWVEIGRGHDLVENWIGIKCCYNYSYCYCA